MFDALESLEQAREVNASFPNSKSIKQWKEENGGKIIGWVCTYVPEEIIYAAGMLPVRITGESHETLLEDASAYLGLTSCSFIRSCFQLGLEGKYDYLDGIAAALTCEGSRYLVDLWREYIGKEKFNHLLVLPRKFTEWADELYLEELEKFKESLEEHFDVQISDEALSQAITAYNESRALLHQIYELRKGDAPPISGAEVLELINASGRMPRDQYNALLHEVVEELTAKERAFHGRSRLMISGSILNNADFVRGVEEMGGLVVVDDICEGTRYFWDMVDSNANMPPLKALAKRYFRKFACPHIIDYEDRMDRVTSLLKEYRVDGVISTVIRYCTSFIVQQPVFVDHLQQRGIPVLELDVEHSMPFTGQVSTRVQAFMEMLEQRSV